MRQVQVGDTLYESQAKIVGRGSVTCNCCDGTGKIDIKNYPDFMCPICMGKGSIRSVTYQNTGCCIGTVTNVDVREDRVDFNTDYQPGNIVGYCQDDGIFLTMEEAEAEAEKRNTEDAGKLTWYDSLHYRNYIKSI